MRETNLFSHWFPLTEEFQPKLWVYLWTYYMHSDTYKLKTNFASMPNQFQLPSLRVTLIFSSNIGIYLQFKKLDGIDDIKIDDTEGNSKNDFPNVDPR